MTNRKPVRDRLGAFARPSGTDAPIGNLWFAYRLFRMQTQSFIRPRLRRLSRSAKCGSRVGAYSGSVQPGAPTIEATMPRVTPVAMFLEIH
jgi:hypothetical protein